MGRQQKDPDRFLAPIYGNRNLPALPRSRRTAGACRQVARFGPEIAGRLRIVSPGAVFQQVEVCRMRTSRWTDDLLEPMRQVGDPEADDLVATIIDSAGMEAIVELMRGLVHNRDLVPHTLPVRVQDYFRRDSELPAWVEPERLVRGEEVFNLHGPEMITMLFFVALPNAYAARKGAQVLALSARLERSVHRRIFRTAQFIMDVMQPGGLGGDGRGIVSAKKIRLIHASIRHYLLHRPEWRQHWDMDWGFPINQEDLAGTLMDFSAGVMRGLDRIRIRLHPQEAEAYLHCWKVVGHFLGIRPELIPENVPDAFDLAETITRRQWARSEAGTELTRDLVGFLQGYIPLKFMRGLIPSALRYLSGDQVADMLETGPSDWTRILLGAQIGLFDLAERFKHRAPWIRKYIRILTYNMVDELILVEENGRRWDFDIPPGLRTDWRL